MHAPALWESWEVEDGRGGTKALHSTTITTIDANELVGGIRRRIPAILPPESYATWLDTSIQEPDDLMEAYSVSTHVNRPANDGPGCVEPA